MTCEPMIRLPLTDRQRDIAEVAMSAPELVEVSEVRELAILNLLQFARDRAMPCVTEPSDTSHWDGSREPDAPDNGGDA
jgi:hypothetical protein